MAKGTIGGKYATANRLSFDSTSTRTFNGEKAPKDLAIPENGTEGNPTISFRGTNYRLVPTEDWDYSVGDSVIAGYTYIPSVETRSDMKKGSFFVSENGRLYSSASQYLIEKNRNSRR